VIDVTLPSACRRHRPALLDFVDHGAIDEATAPALAHLERCERCTMELESTVLAITALRRLGDDIARVEPAPDAWPRLRARLDRWRPFRWSILSPSAGVLMSAAIVAVLVAPIQIGSSGLAGPNASAPIVRPPVPTEERRIELDYMTSSRQLRSVSQPAALFPLRQTPEATSASYPRNYPDNIRPERKEVTPAEPSGRRPEAI
jgi:anti-sigma factor RsiW